MLNFFLGTSWCPTSPKFNCFHSRRLGNLSTHRVIGPSLPGAQVAIFIRPRLFRRNSFTTVASNITFKPTELTSVQDKRCIGTVGLSFNRLFMLYLWIYRLTINNALYLLEEESNSSQAVTFGSTMRPRWVQVVDIGGLLDLSSLAESSSRKPKGRQAFSMLVVLYIIPSPCWTMFRHRQGRRYPQECYGPFSVDRL